LKAGQGHCCLFSILISAAGNSGIDHSFPVIRVLIIAFFLTNCHGSGNKNSEYRKNIAGRIFMRLHDQQKSFLKKRIKEQFPGSRIYLFGSRADDTKKGGDIDILLLSKEKLSLKDKWSIKRDFCGKFGEQEMDIVNFSFEEESNFKEIALLEAVEL
jgi:predicted nucleotidyltransferase